MYLDVARGISRGNIILGEYIQYSFSWQAFANCLLCSVSPKKESQKNENKDHKITENDSSIIYLSYDTLVTHIG